MARFITQKIISESLSSLKLTKLLSFRSLRSVNLRADSEVNFSLLLFTYALLFSFLPFSTLSDDYIWDGDAGDGLWLTAENWNNDQLPVFDADVIIDSSFTVTFNAANYMVESINLIDGAQLIIPPGNILNTTKGAAFGSDGIRLIGNANTTTGLHIYGTLNVSMDTAPGEAVDINQYSMVHVYPSGTLNIMDAGSHGMEISELLINEGIINIANTSSSGIKTKGASGNTGMVHNMAGGQITLSGIPGKAINMTGDIPFVNDGTINIVGEEDVVFYSNEEALLNNGVFNASGVINSSHFEHGPNSTISISTPVGTLGFKDSNTMLNNKISIGINGIVPGANCDQIQQINGMITLDNTTLELSGNYIPQASDTLVIIDTHYPDSSTLIGTFQNLPEAAELSFNGVTMYISYIAGDGKDVVLLSNPPGTTDTDGDGFFSHIDCDDLNAAINPSAIEIINNAIDEDCDGIAQIIDNDGDGYHSFEDCDDQNPAINPGATEIPNNNIDENCDGQLTIIDIDGDGFYSDVDCNDQNPAINPGATEIPNNNIDENCDGEILIIDQDMDGFNSDEDCDDTNAAVNPSAVEIPNNNTDEDCSGIADVIDQDSDGFHSDEDCNDLNPSIYPGALEIPNNGIDEDCDGEIYVIDMDMDGANSDDDCDDENPNIYPGATEIPNNDIDEDCNGIALMIDVDMDGANSDVDCDDNNAAIFPGAVEIPNNEIDEDCDGVDLITIGTNDLLELEVTLFPNPTDGLVIIKAAFLKEAQLELRDYSGRVVLVRLFQEETQIDLSGFPSGLYLVSVNIDGGNWTRRVVKR